MMMTKEQLDALKAYIEAKIREMKKHSDLHDSIRLKEAESELEEHLLDEANA